MSEIKTYDYDFKEYLERVKNCVTDNKLKYNQIGRNIRSLNINDTFIDNNISYFEEQHKCGYSPENVLDQIETDINELYVKIEDISDDYFTDEFNNRNLARYNLSNVDTDDLERELDSRWDTSYRNIHSLSRNELLDLLNIEEGDVLDGYDSIKEVICKALGFPNSFAYSVDDIITEIKNRIR